MPRLGPIRRGDLISYLRQFGFVGPIAGGKHEYMERGRHRIRIPNPHRGDIGIHLLVAVLHEAGISRQEWERL